MNSELSKPEMTSLHHLRRHGGSYRADIFQERELTAFLGQLVHKGFVDRTVVGENDRNYALTEKGWKEVEVPRTV